MTPFFCIASNRPEKAMKHLIKLPPHWGRILFYCHRDHEQRFIDSIFKPQRRQGEHYFIPIDQYDINVVTHLFSNHRGVPFGALRYFGMLLVQQMMRDDEYGVLMDDDVKAIRGPYDGRLRPNTPYHSFPSLRGKSEFIISETEKLAQTAKTYGFNYFTTSYNADGKCGFFPDRPLRAGYAWSCFFGFFKHSRNPFDPYFTQGADAKAQIQIVDWEGRLPVLTHKGLVFDFEINTRAYRPGGSRDRSENLQRIVQKFPQWACISESCKRTPGRDGQVRLPNPKIELNRKERMLLAQQVEEQFR